MVSDKHLTRISLTISIIGLVALFIFVQFTEPIKINVSRIDDSMLGQNVELSGQIESFSARDGNVFFTISDGTGKIKVVMFESNARRNADVYALADQMNVSITGKISLYKSELEIIASSIELIG